MFRSTLSILTTVVTVAIVLTFAGVANAATIVWDFNDNDAVVDNNDLAADDVTTNNVTFSSTTGNTASIANQRAQRDLGNSQGSETSTFNFTLKIGATPINLTQLNFTHGLDVNAGSVVDNYFKWDLVITTTGSETPGASQATFAEYHDNGGVAPDEIDFDESVTLSGLNNLTNVDVTFAFTGHYGTAANYTGGSNTNRFIYLDDVTFTGAVVPVPGSLALLAVGGLLIASRRRGG